MSNKEYKLFNILLAIALVVLGVLSLTQQGHFQCVYTEIGQTCNGCGLTRSFRYAILLNFKEAYQFNPSGIVFYTWWIFNLFYRLIAILTPTKVSTFQRWDLIVNLVALLIFIISIYRQ